MDMKIYRVGSRPSTKGSEQYFTGNVRLDPLFEKSARVMLFFCNCGKKHWHGATDTTSMSHIAGAGMA